ncbi:hypothetical protein SJAV_00320 [Sulfurisphaera javensis]|uniref:Glycine zipper 2TM domain-containing protein n=1 Tax=Sulfurisphaera javensis TaxID=2049879 RepID=A0AAT9GMZ9_9CREN
MIEAKKKKLSTDEVKEVANRCLKKLDDTPIIKELKSERIMISLRVNANSLPNSKEICNNIVNTVMNIVEELHVIWISFQIVETVTFEEMGAVGGAVVGGGAGYAASKDNTNESQLISTAISLAIGSMLGYVIGRNIERVEKILCEYTNYYGYPVRVL